MLEPRDVFAKPLTLPGGATIPNRLAKSAMSENLAADDLGPTEALVQLYRRWARGGIGLIVTGNVIVAPGGRVESNNVVIEDERHLSRLRDWATAARSGGAQAWVQVNHGGRQSPRAVTGDLVAPSAVPLKGMGGMFGTPRPLTDAEIRGLIQRYAATAAVVESAGFTGVQVHGAHGYLVSQFLSPRTNQRSDRWGGDIDGRMQFLLEIVRAIRAVVSPGFVVSVKLNSADFQRGGFTNEESILVAQALEAEGIDLLELSGGSYEAPAMMGSKKMGSKKMGPKTPVRESTRRREAFFLEYAEKIRAAVSVPLMLTGGFRSARGMAEAIDGGAIDVVGIARPLATQPDLPADLLSGAVEAATPYTPRIGVKLLDDMLQIIWFQRQLHRMGAGLEPDPGLGRYSSIFKMVSHNYAGQVRRLFSRQRADELASPTASEGAR